MTRLWYILYSLFEAPFGNVSKYLQKLGMGIYNNPKKVSVLKKITWILGNRILVHNNWK